MGAKPVGIPQMAQRLMWLVLYTISCSIAETSTELAVETSEAGRNGMNSTAVWPDWSQASGEENKGADMLAVGAFGAYEEPTSATGEELDSAREYEHQKDVGRSKDLGEGMGVNSAVSPPQKGDFVVFGGYVMDKRTEL